MKKLLAILFVALISQGCAGSFERHMLGAMGTTSFENEPDGFRDVKWGATPGTLPDFRLLRNGNQKLTYYKRENDRLEIGAAKLDSIEYCFFDNKLHSVTVKTAIGQDNWHNMRQAVHEKFGSGYSPNILADQYFIWAGPVTMVELRNFYTYGTLTMTSRKIAEELAVFQKTAAEKAAGTDF